MLNIQFHVSTIAFLTYFMVRRFAAFFRVHVKLMLLPVPGAMYVTI